uniref:45 kDa calcium-binding protein n=1 Tax=Rhabditophanes sp. KR3021 TaxID=114890 RepID=A0AC35U9T1_9BILA
MKKYSISLFPLLLCHLAVHSINADPQLGNGRDFGVDPSDKIDIPREVLQALRNQPTNFHPAFYVPDEMLKHDLQGQSHTNIPIVPSGFITVPAKFSPVRQQLQHQQPSSHFSQFQQQPPPHLSQFQQQPPSHLSQFQQTLQQPSQFRQSTQFQQTQFFPDPSRKSDTFQKMLIFPENQQRSLSIPRHPGFNLPFRQVQFQNELTPTNQMISQTRPTHPSHNPKTASNPFPPHQPSPNPVRKMQQQQSLNMFSTFPTDYHFPNDNKQQQLYKHVDNDNFGIAPRNSILEGTNLPHHISSPFTDDNNHHHNNHNNLPAHNINGTKKDLFSPQPLSPMTPLLTYHFADVFANGIKNNPVQEPFPKKEGAWEEIKSFTKPPHPKRQRRRQHFEKSIDLNGDNALELSEVSHAAFVHHGLSSSVVTSIFESVDYDKSRTLDWDEFNDMKPMILEKALNAANRYMLTVDLDHNGKLSLEEAQRYVLKEFGIGYRDVERVWLLVVSRTTTEMDVNSFANFRRRLRGMSIRLAKHVMKHYDGDGDMSINFNEAKRVAYEQEGIEEEEVESMVAAVDEDNNGELSQAEFSDFLRLIRYKAVETAKKALKVLDTDRSQTISMSEAKKIAFEQYGYDEWQLAPMFDSADENEDGVLNYVEFASFRNTIRSQSIKSASLVLKLWDTNLNKVIDLDEARVRVKNEDGLGKEECERVFNIADYNQDGILNKIEFADFLRLVRMSSIKVANENMNAFDKDKNNRVTLDEIGAVISAKYGFSKSEVKDVFERVDSDASGHLSAGEIVDFRHQIRKLVDERGLKHETITPSPLRKVLLKKMSSDQTSTVIVTTTTTQSPPPTQTDQNDTTFDIQSHDDASAALSGENVMNNEKKLIKLVINEPVQKINVESIPKPLPIIAASNEFVDSTTLQTTTTPKKLRRRKKSRPVTTTETPGK